MSAHPSDDVRFYMIHKWGRTRLHTVTDDPDEARRWAKEYAKSYAVDEWRLVKETRETIWEE